MNHLKIMSKKRTALLLCLLIGLSASLSACSDSSAQSADRTEKTGGVEDVLEAGMQEQDGASEPGGAAEDSEPAGAAEAGRAAEASEPGEATGATESAGNTASLATDVDVDLTVLSATMVYSEVYNMMKNPDEYIGKSVRMRGEFAYFKDESTGKEYFACIIKDATACCAQGIEFELAGDYKYPEDYPELGSEVTVKGVFDTYKEGDNQYATLRNAQRE